jgi:tRNA A-37 threonylcarbamoyl transferase component Bud32
VLITARLEHPSIPPVYAAGTTSRGEQYLLMKLIQGRPLSRVLEDHDWSRRVDEAELRWLHGQLEALVKVGEAVAHAHARDVVHRDLKPSNIMLGELGEVLVMAWGLAKDQGSSEEDDDAVRRDEPPTAAMEEAVAKGLTKAAHDMAEAKDEANKLGKSFEDMGENAEESQQKVSAATKGVRDHREQIKLLRAEYEKTTRTIADLDAQLLGGEGDSKGIRKDLREQRSLLAEIRRVAREVERDSGIKINLGGGGGGVAKAGLGISTAVGIGGDPIIGTTTKEAIELFMNDPETDAIVMIGEIGGGMEAEAANWIKENGNKKPVVGFIAGQTAPPGRRMGHAGAIVGGEDDTAAAKMKIMSACGINVVSSPADIGKKMAEVLGKS